MPNGRSQAVRARVADALRGVLQPARLDAEGADVAGEVADRALQLAQLAPQIGEARALERRRAGCRDSNRERARSP